MRSLTPGLGYKKNLKSDTHSIELSERFYPYQVVRSKKAKHIRIKLSNNGVLSLVLPVNTSEQLAHSFIQSKSVWVEKNLNKISFAEKEIIPELLNLRLLNEVWNIDYIDSDSDSNEIQLKEGSDLVLTILGNT